MAQHKRKRKLTKAGKILIGVVSVLIVVLVVFGISKILPKEKNDVIDKFTKKLIRTLIFLCIRQAFQCSKRCHNRRSVCFLQRHLFYLISAVHTAAGFLLIFQRIFLPSKRKS